MKIEKYEVSKNKYLEIYAEEDGNGDLKYFQMGTNEKIGNSDSIYDEAEDEAYEKLFDEFEKCTGINYRDALDYFDEDFSTVKEIERNAYGRRWFEWEAYAEFDCVPLSESQVKQLKKNGWTVIQEE
jgi:hypothetical protein